MLWARPARRAVLAAGVLAGLALRANAARADALKGPDGTWFSAGANVGAALHAGKPAFVLGAEASVVHWRRGMYAGLYVDGLRDFAEDRTRFSVGPELGLWVFGLDFGYLADVGDGRVRHGLVVRPFLSVALVAPYARFGFREERDGGAFQELGVLLKLPFEPPRLSPRKTDARVVARPRPSKTEPNVPLGLRASLRRAHGERGPIAVVPTALGVEWVSHDGQHGVLARGDVRWVLVDDRAEVVWFLVNDGDSAELRVLDLTAIDPVQVTAVRGLRQDDFVGVAYQEGDGTTTRLFDQTGVYDGRVELVLGAGEPALRYERGIYEQVMPPGDGTEPVAPKTLTAELVPAALSLLRTLVERGAGRHLVAPAPVAPVQHVAAVHESRCGQSELCGTAEPVPGTRYQRVLVAHACGDVCHVRYQLYDPAFRQFLDVASQRRSPTPIDDGEPLNLVDVWVSLDGRALVKDGVVYDLTRGRLFGHRAPVRYGGGFLGGGYRLE